MTRPLMCRPQRKGLPSISLVTCSYQQARFLDATIRSVLAQSYPNLEYIVMDGGSSDGSKEIIEKYDGNIDYWVSEPDGGQTAALIRGFEQSHGDIMGWLCSDDLLLPGALQDVAAYFDKNPDVDAVYGDSVWIDACGKPLRIKREIAFSRFIVLYDHCYVPQPAMFWRRRLYERVGGLDANFDLAMDLDLWARFSLATEIQHVQAYWAGMRSYADQKTQQFDDKGLRERETIRNRYGGRMGAQWARPLCRMAARGLRVAKKTAIGGYRNNLPASLTEWLAYYETPA